MRTVCQVLTVIFVLAFIGNATQGKFFLGGFILACICGYFGFVRDKTPNEIENKQAKVNPNNKPNFTPNETRNLEDIKASNLKNPSLSDLELVADIPKSLLNTLAKNYLELPSESTAFTFLKVLVNTGQDKNIEWIDKTIEKCIRKFINEYPTQLGFYFLAMSFYASKNLFDDCFRYLEVVEMLKNNMPIAFGQLENNMLEEFRSLKKVKGGEIKLTSANKVVTELQELNYRISDLAETEIKILYEQIETELRKNTFEPNYIIDKLMDEFLYTKFPTNVEIHFLGITYYLKKDNFYAAEKIAHLLSKKGHDGVVNLTSEQMSTIFQTFDKINNSPKNKQLSNRTLDKSITESKNHIPALKLVYEAMPSYATAFNLLQGLINNEIESKRNDTNLEIENNIERFIDLYPDFIKIYFLGLEYYTRKGNFSKASSVLIKAREKVNNDDDLATNENLSLMTHYTKLVVLL
jgi:hypothetical protein